MILFIHNYNLYDLKNLRKLCELLDSVDPKSDGADRSYIDVFDESEKLLYEEIDYLNEAKNADRFREQFANDPQVRVPEMIYEYGEQRPHRYAVDACRAAATAWRWCGSHTGTPSPRHPATESSLCHDAQVLDAQGFDHGVY